MLLKFRKSLFLPTAGLAIFIGGCSVEASKKPAATAESTRATVAAPVSAPKGATIKITANGPADTVRAFYRHLREGKVREAIYLTNLRPAIEGLTDSELKQFQGDFDAVAKHVPAELEINGEFVSGDSATVTAKLPGEDLDKPEFQQIRLRKQGDYWVVLTVDDEAEKLIKKEGKNYFYALKIKAHEDDAREMLDRVAKAQLAHSVQNRGLYGDMQSLIAGGLLPEDIRSSASTGYNYSITLSDDKKKYSAIATPAEYGKSGKLTFFVNQDAKGQARLTSKDEGSGKKK